MLFGRRAKRISLFKDGEISLKKEERPDDVEVCEAEAYHCLLRLGKTNQHAVPTCQSEESMFHGGNKQSETSVAQYTDVCFTPLRNAPLEVICVR